MKMLFFAGSLRRQSFNKKYAKLAYEVFREREGVEAEYVDLLDFQLPVYNADLETPEFPKAAIKLAEKVAASQAVVISSPENNGSIAALTKNTLDWISRVPKTPWAGKHILLMGATPGALGAVRGLWHTRIPFEALGAFVYPEMLGLAKAHEAFDDQGAFKDPANQERLRKVALAFLAHVTPQPNLR